MVTKDYSGATIFIIKNRAAIEVKEVILITDEELRSIVI